MANNYCQFSFMIRDLSFDETSWVRTLLDEDEEDVAGANVELDPDGLWIYAHWNGSPDKAANFVQTFLAEHRPDARVGFTWASTCSKPRLDEFDGGGVVVSATDKKWMNASSWVHETLRKP